MHAILIALSTSLVLFSSTIYAYSIVKGQTRPHRTTRFVLLVITLLSTAALWRGSAAAFILALTSMIQALGLFLLSIKKGMGGWSKVDISCLIIAMIGVVFWQLSGQPLVGLLASIIADTTGMIPAIIKTYKHPHTEQWQFFGIDTIAGTLSLLALSSFTVYTVSYPLYIILINALMTGLILLRSKQIHAMIKSDEKTI